jgi:uncharacterized protein YjiS (DUF1127 family)
MTTRVLKYRAALRHTTISSVLTDAWETIGLWCERARQRRHLAEMSPQMLADIGLSRSAARAEAGKPFWLA